jgi:hypothetical protein
LIGGPLAGRLLVRQGQLVEGKENGIITFTNHIYKDKVTQRLCYDLTRDFKKIPRAISKFEAGAAYRADLSPDSIQESCVQQ